MSNPSSPDDDKNSANSSNQENALPVAPTTGQGEDAQAENQSTNSLPPVETEGKNDSRSLELPPRMEFETPSGKVDLDQLAIGQNFADLTGVVIDQVSIPLKKPGRQEWFSPYPEIKQWRQYAILKDESDGEFYVVPPPLIPELGVECTIKILVPCLTKAGNWLVWPVGGVGPDGKMNSWNESCQRIIRKYAGQWVRITANRQASGYDVSTSKIATDPPVWPDNIDSVIEKAVGGKIIKSLEHPVVKRLRGEI